MTNWKQFAERVKSEKHGGDNRANRANSPDAKPNVPIVPIVPLDPARAVALWRDGLASVSLELPAMGLSRDRWAQLVRDARWLFDAFGKELAAAGWTTTDLFGVRYERDGWGGLADRLGGARSVVLHGDRACWSAWGVGEEFRQGNYPLLVSVWEAK